MQAGASFQLFLGGGQILFRFFNATGPLKNWKKQHFICSNLTSFIVPFFLFFSFFLFFLCFFLFFFFSFSLGGRRPPQPPLNDASACKSEAILFGTHQRLRTFPATPSIHISDTEVELSDQITSLGVVMDSNLTFNAHTALCKACHFHLRSLRHIRRSLICANAALLLNTYLYIPISLTRVIPCVIYLFSESQDC